MPESDSKTPGELSFQGWVTVALWMTFGLLLESLLAYKSPAYLADAQRRELFRLAHAHGALLGLVLVIAALWVRSSGAAISRAAVNSLRLGAAFMPLGFFLSGLWHPEGDPGLGIWLVPPAALCLLFGLISIAWSSRAARM
jgi:hypothetical protein